MKVRKTWAYCTCSHTSASHRAGGPCRGTDDDGEHCACTQFEADDED